MKRKLEMDDIREGMYITVLQGKLEQRVFPGPDGPKVRVKEKDHYNGKILEVTAMDMPFIAVIVHERMGSRTDSLDLRVVQVMRLSEEYIHKLLPKLKINYDEFWDEIEKTALEESDIDIEELFKSL